MSKPVRKGVFSNVFAAEVGEEKMWEAKRSKAFGGTRRSREGDERNVGERSLFEVSPLDKGQRSGGSQKEGTLESHNIW